MSVYAIPIKIGLIIFPIIALLITIPYMIKQYHKYGSIPFLRSFIVYSFVLYILIAWFMVILPLPRIEEVAKMTGPWTQLVPFNGLKEIISSTNFSLFKISSWIETLKSPSVYTVLFNFLLTLPFGVYLRYYFKRKWWEVITLTFLLSFFFEVTQLSCLFGIYPRPYRLFDVDDLIVNTTGGFLGYLLTPLFSKILPSRETLDEESYNKGKKVSYPRRIIANLIDFILICVITFLLPIKNSYLDLFLLTYIYLIYYILFTWILNGRTLGKYIVGIRIVNIDGKKAKLNQILIRYTVKYFLLFEVFYATLALKGVEKLGSFGIFLESIIYLMLFVLYFISFINLFRGKQPVYESLSKTIHVSTIKNKKIKDNKKEENT